MHNNEDYETKDEKIYDFMFKNRLKIILYSFIFSLCIFIISLITSNRGGLYSIILYPLALIGFIVDLLFKNGIGKYRLFTFSIFVMLMLIITFILGYFISI